MCSLWAVTSVPGGGQSTDEGDEKSMAGSGDCSLAEAKATCGAGVRKARGQDSVTEDPLTSCLRVEAFSLGTGRPPEEFEHGEVRLEF